MFMSLTLVHVSTYSIVMRVNEDLLYQQIGERIRERRSKAKLTQGQLAEAVGVLRTSITNIEAGRQKAPLHVLYELCTVLGADVAEILPSRTDVVQKSEMSIEIGGRVKTVPPKSAELIQQLLKE